jgi:two-component system response regulator PilR (NtrC family)/two-component system response regulator HydG
MEKANCMAHNTKLLLVADNLTIQKRMSNFLSRHGYAVFSSSYTSDVTDIIVKNSIEIALISCGTKPSLTSPCLQLLQDIKQIDERIEVVLLVPRCSSEFALKAAQLGAADCISAPGDRVALLQAMKRVEEYYGIRKQTGQLERDIRTLYTFQGMISRNPRMLEVFNLIKRLARPFTSILITGETGTGKEMVARALHDLSPRGDKKFVPCNCSAFPETLLERELFGHVKGSFTGATDFKPGIFEYADGGTVFLDEIAEMPVSLQAKLLRVLEDRTIRRIGSPHETPVDVRIITATNRDLRLAIKGGHFREDLFYRINVIDITLPPLRDRKDDIPLLCHYFLAQINSKCGKNIKGISRSAQLKLMEHPWEGNVRELQNVIESTALLTAKDYISDGDIDAQLEKSGGSLKAPADCDDDLTLEEVERRHIARILAKTGGNRVQAAAALGISRRSLLRRVKKLSIK